jgi:diacylglycerol kinase (ATP)
MSPDDQMAMDHQWLEGNLPGNSKCAVCEKACGSARRLQDWSCLWCRATVHNDCLASFLGPCSLGPNHVSILPPTAIRAWDMCEQGRAEAVRPPGSSPLLVFVNSKSGDNEGVKFLRRFKQLLNPAQVFDLITTGPFVGLHLFQSFESFRILICGGDGSVGWVLTAIDKLGLTNKCQVGILPLGTGNDLARVLGWGSTCDDNSQLPHILNELESSGFKMLDRWSIQTKPISPPSTVIRRKLSALPPVFDKKVERRISVSSQEAVATAKLEKSVASHLAVILSEESRDYDVIDSTRFLCEHIQTFVTSVCEQKDEKESCTGDKILREKCHLLNEKLESLMSTLQQESQSSLVHPVMEQSSSVESTDGDSSGDYDDMVRKLANIMHQPVINGKEERQKELEVSNEPVLGIKPELKSKVSYPHLIVTVNPT